VNRWLEQPFSRVLALEHALDHDLPVKGIAKRIGDSVVTVIRGS
jgi:hypothetical protein